MDLSAIQIQDFKAGSLQFGFFDGGPNLSFGAGGKATIIATPYEDFFGPVVNGQTVAGGGGNDLIMGFLVTDFTAVWRVGDGSDTYRLPQSVSMTLLLKGWGADTSIASITSNGQTVGDWIANRSIVHNSSGNVSTLTLTHIPEGDVQSIIWADFQPPNITIKAVGNVICFYPGTLIATPTGPRAVETLAIGDLVLTSDDRAMPVRWMGRQTICTTFADERRTLPVRIPAGALGENVPQRDLLVSPRHALFLDGVLVEAGALIGLPGIRQETNVPAVFTYYHVELWDHALVLAEGVPAETFVDNASRENFDNWDEHEALYGHLPPIEELDIPRAQSFRQLPRALKARLGALRAA